METNRQFLISGLLIYTFEQAYSQHIAPLPDWYSSAPRRSPRRRGPLSSRTACPGVGIHEGNILPQISKSKRAGYTLPAARNISLVLVHPLTHRKVFQVLGHEETTIFNLHVLPRSYVVYRCLRTFGPAAYLDRGPDGGSHRKH